MRCIDQVRLVCSVVGEPVVITSMYYVLLQDVISVKRGNLYTKPLRFLICFWRTRLGEERPLEAKSELFAELLLEPKYDMGRWKLVKLS